MAKFGIECGDFDNVWSNASDLERYIDRVVDHELAEYMGAAVCLMVRTPNMVAFGRLLGQSAGRGFTGPVNRFGDGRMVSVLCRPAEYADDFPYPELEIVEAHPNRVVALGPVSLNYRITRDQCLGLVGVLGSKQIDHDVRSAHDYEFVQVGLDGHGLPVGIDVRFRVDHTPYDVAMVSAK